MENAGRGVVDVMQQLGIQGPVLIACGKGNNAGDGFVIARHLDLRDFEVNVICFAEPSSLRGDAQANYQLLQHTRAFVHHFEQSEWSALRNSIPPPDWAVDALLGTGVQGSPRPPYDLAIDWLNSLDANRLAVDLPSGLDAESGAVAPTTFRADHTCTFVAAKPGLVHPQAKEFVGQLRALDIGAPRRLLDRFGV